MLGTFIVYSVYVIRHGSDELEETVHHHEKNKQAFPKWALLISPLSGAAIYFGAYYTVEAIQKIADHLNVPAAIISLTALSVGTTLPEIAVKIIVIKQGKTELAVGNVLGSCVFNALAIPGIAGFFGKIYVPVELLEFPLPTMVIASIFFYLLTLDKKISKWEGFLFIVFYVIFLLKVVNLI